MNSIEIANISKLYKIYNHPFDRVKDWLTPKYFRFYKEFWALKDISFRVRKGASLGIIGVNGAGKSTLLKILSKTTSPTSGSYSINGRVSALLELGTGFHPDFTGIQNIYMNGRLLGMSDEFLSEKVASIIDFSELGDFIDRPLRTYSTGMNVRLAFSVAAAVDPDVLIVDEALAVGDVHFQQKCIKRIRQFKEEGKTILFVSHDPGIVQSLCDEAILLNDGQLADLGKPDEILDHYNALIAKRSAKNVSLSIERVEYGQSEKRVQRSGNFLALISGVSILNSKGEPATSFISGEHARITVNVFFFEKINNPTIGVQIKDRLGQPVFGINSNILKHNTGKIKPGDTLTVNYDLPLNIGEGEYTLTVAAHTSETHLEECFDWADKIMTLQILCNPQYKFYGVANLPVALTSEAVSVKPENLSSELAAIFKDAPKMLSMGMENQKFLCKGWYLPQGASGSEERWTDKEFACFLSLGESEIALEAASYKPDQHIHPVKGEMFIEEVSVGRFEINSSNYTIFRFPIPKQFAGSVRFVRGVLNESWSPNFYDSSNSDARTLGVMVKRISAL